MLVKINISSTPNPKSLWIVHSALFRGIEWDSMKFILKCAAIAHRFKPTVSYQQVRTFDPSSAHLCMCLIWMCVSSNNIRSNIKLWNGLKLFLNSTSRSLSCLVAIKDFYHKLLRSTWGPVCSAMKYERVPRSDAIPTTFPFIYFKIFPFYLSPVLMAIIMR